MDRGSWREEVLVSELKGSSKRGLNMKMPLLVTDKEISLVLENLEGCKDFRLDSMK